jgi:hypothetical protein
LEEIHVDEIVRHLQGRLKKAALDGLSAVSMWMGVAGRRAMNSMDRSSRTIAMTEESKPREANEPEAAEVIQFYVPVHFVRPVQWIPAWRRGKLIPFRPNQKKTA